MYLAHTVPNISSNPLSESFDMLHSLIPEITQEVYELIKLNQPFEKCVFNVLFTVDNNNTLLVFLE